MKVDCEEDEAVHFHLGINKKLNNLRTLDSSNLVSVSIHDMAGRRVEERHLSGAQQHFDTSAWPEGVYFVTCRTEPGEVRVAKIIVQH